MWEKELVEKIEKRKMITNLREGGREGEREGGGGGVNNYLKQFFF